MNRHLLPWSNRRMRSCLLNSVTLGSLAICQIATVAANDSLSELDYYGPAHQQFSDAEPSDLTYGIDSASSTDHEETVLTESMPSLDSDVECQNCPSDGNAKDACPGVCRDPGFPAKPKRQLPGDIDKGDCPGRRYQMDDCLRAGDPNCVYKWASPSITDKYSAWYTGGGAVFKGRGRTAEEGTWGLDYNGLFGHAKTWMNYTCGKYQGGEGAYDGEHVPLKKKLKAGH